MPPFFFFFFCRRNSPLWARASSFTRFINHAERRATVGRTPLDEWSARRRDLYLTTQNNHNRHPSMPPVGFEPTVSVVERPQTFALDRAATGTGTSASLRVSNFPYWRYTLLILLMEEWTIRRPRIKTQFYNRISPSPQHDCNTYGSSLFTRSELSTRRDVCCVISYQVGIKYGGSLLLVSKF